MTVNHETIHYEQCPVCSSSIKKWRVKAAGDDRYILDRCDSCGYSFVNPRPSLKYLMDYYSSFGHGHAGSKQVVPTLQSVMADEQNYPNTTIDARRLIGTIKSLSRSNHIKSFLDVGCGYGFFSREALAAGFDVIALELAENERNIAQDMIGLQPVASAFEDFECSPESLSVVLMSQILEHALDVNSWVEKAHRLLVREGILAIALPNFSSIFRMIMQEKEPFICPPAHLNFFSPHSLSTLLARHGFEVEATQWVSRLPISAFEKRLPKMGKPLLPIIDGASSVVLKVIDALHLGMIINVYARKN